MRWSTVCRVIAAGCLLILSTAKAQDEELDYSWAPVTKKEALSDRSHVSSCLTPSYNRGTCVPVPECPAAVKILQRGPLDAQNRRILERSLCYAYAREAPVVCCTRPAKPSSGNAVTPRATTPEPPPSSKSPPPSKSPPTRDASTKSSDDLENHENAQLLPIGDCGKSSGSRIFGGKETNLGDFPWMALLKYRIGNKEGFHCGGSLINNRYVLTAAHCMDSAIPRNARLLAVRIGEHDIKTDPDCQTIKPSGKRLCAPPVQEIPVEESFAHPNYNKADRARRYNDIALVRLRRTVEFHGYVQPICLPFGDVGHLDLVNRRLWTAGWGKNEITQSDSEVKLKVNIPVTGFTQCAAVFRQVSVIDDNEQMCAGGEMGKDSCNGDSGGPLMGPDKGAFYQYGIVSFGNENCGQAGWPGVYTRVSSHLKWILDNIRA